MAKKKKGGKGSAKATNNPKTNKGSRGPKSTNEKKYQKTMIMDLTEEDRKFRNSLESGEGCFPVL